jgi:O-antigen ligase
MPRLPDPQGLAYGLAALILFAPLVDGGTTFVPATVIRIGAVGLAAHWLVRALGPTGDWRRETPLDGPVVLFVLLAALSTLASSIAYQSIQGFLGLATGALVFVVAGEVARDRRGARLIVGAIVGGGVAQGLLAVVQRASSVDRAAGTYFNPNFLAMALVMAGALLLALRPSRRGRAVLVWAGLAVAGAGLVISQSRGGVLAAAAAWGLIGWHRWRWRAVGVGVAVALALVVVPNPLGARLRDAHVYDPLAYSRLQVWASAVQRAWDHPFGVGLNRFRQSSQQYAFPVEGELARYGRRAESAHNQYLEILAELGLPGLVIALWGGAVLARRGARVLRARPGADTSRLGGGPPREGSPPTVGAAAALAGLAVHAVVDTPLAVPGIVVQGAALAGLLLAASPGEHDVPSPPVPAVLARLRSPAGRLAVGVLCLVAALGVARHGAAYLASERAVVARDAGDPGGARRWLEWAAAFAPASPAYPDAIAAASVMAWRASRDPADAVLAEQMMLRAMRLDPEDAQRYARLAQVYREVTPSDPEVLRRALLRAKALYLEAERLDPHMALFAFERAEVLLRLDDRDGAVAALERAIALEPRFLPARLNLARLRTARGEPAAAAAQYAAIEATLAAYDAQAARAAAGPFLRSFLGVDRAAVRREAAALAGERS